MLIPKIFHANLMGVLREREKRGQPLFRKCIGWDGLNDLPVGAIVIHPSGEYNEDSELPNFARISTEPFIICTDMNEHSLMVSNMHDFEAVDLGDLDLNYSTDADGDEEVDELMLLVIDDLNFTFTDCASPVTKIDPDGPIYTQSTFKPGDKVRVARKVVRRTNGWDNSWDDGGMCRYVNDGKIYTVSRINNAGVYFTEKPEYGWPWHSLEFADKPVVAPPVVAPPVVAPPVVAPPVVVKSVTYRKLEFI